MKRVIYERYETFEDYRKTINNRPDNQVFANQLKTSNGVTDRKVFSCGTSNYGEAEELATNGYKEPLEKIKAGIQKVQSLQATPRKRSFNNVIGYAPHVPNAIIGIPQAMIDIKNTPEPTKIITLVYMKTFSGNIRKDQIIKAGINALGLVQQLEQNGYRIAIDLLDVSIKMNEIAACRINLKTHRHPIDFLKLTYPMVHSSMLRRHMFKWLETVPGLSEKAFIGGYGAPLDQMVHDYNEQVKYLKQHGILKENEYLVNGVDAIDNTPDALLKICGIK